MSIRVECIYRSLVAATGRLLRSAQNGHLHEMRARLGLRSLGLLALDFNQTSDSVRAL
jgi:hypothetical protein